MLLINGYAYQKIDTRNGITYWRCQQQRTKIKCPAKCQTRGLLLLSKSPRLEDFVAECKHKDHGTLSDAKIASMRAHAQFKERARRETTLS